MSKIVKTKSYFFSLPVIFAYRFVVYLYACIIKIRIQIPIDYMKTINEIFFQRMILKFRFQAKSQQKTRRGN